MGVLMQISRDVGLPIVEAFEGCLAPVAGKPGLFKPYFCPAGVLTQGYGHTDLGGIPPKVVLGTLWDKAQCDAALANDMAVFEKHVADLAPNIADQNRFDALVSWSFNTGGPADSSVWTYARQGDVAETVVRLKRWNKARVNGELVELKGLTRRRAAESALFEGNPDEALSIAGTHRADFEPMPQQLPRPRPPASEIAKRAAPEIGAGAAAGGAATISKTEQPPPAAPGAAPSPASGGGLGGGVTFYIFVALVVVAVVFLIGKIGKIHADWA
ncbi:MAG TPA: lysozyme [Xanthobacteraceae bacterium]|nr:lysozyme [Xanthobacteraceae bacterium]